MQIINLELKSLKVHQSKKSWIKSTHVDSLIESISKQGLLTPLIVTKTGDIYEVLSGAHRLAALQSLGYDCAPCIIVDEEEEPFELLLHLDCLQRQTNPLQEGQFLKSLIELGYSQEQLSHLVGKSSSWVQHRLALVVQLVKPLQDEVARGYLSAKKAQDIARLPASAQQCFAFLVHKQNLSARDVEKLVALYNNPKTSEELKRCILTTPKLALQPVQKEKGKRNLDPELRSVCNVIDETKGKLENIKSILDERELSLNERKQFQSKFGEVFALLRQLQAIVSRPGDKGTEEVRDNDQSERSSNINSGVLSGEQDISSNTVSVQEEIQGGRLKRINESTEERCGAKQSFNTRTDKPFGGRQTGKSQAQCSNITSYSRHKTDAVRCSPQNSSTSPQTAEYGQRMETKKAQDPSSNGHPKPNGSVDGRLFTRGVSPPPT